MVSVCGAKATECGPNEKVVNHVCTACPSGKTSTGNHDASGSDTTCEATSLCLSLSLSFASPSVVTGEYSKGGRTGPCL